MGFRVLLVGTALSATAHAANHDTPTLGLTLDNLSPLVKHAEYAVRGRLLSRAVELAADGRDIVRCNIGNPQALGQRPLTWIRQVLALSVNPDLLAAAEAAHAAGGADAPLVALFPADVVARARTYVDACRSVGAYSDSQGVKIVREHVAASLEKRDGCPMEPSDIFITDGASAGVKLMMQCLVATPEVDAILSPLPVYPLYSAMTTLLNGARAGYPLHEDAETGAWSVRLADLEAALADARARGLVVRALVIINPGNPTGQCMSADEVRDVLAFAAREGLVLLADEVYQDNVYNAPDTPHERAFCSFRRALAQMRVEAPELAERAQLVSMHSISKGYMGECGLRGGYIALDGNWDPAVKAMMVKLASISLCSNLMGQLAMGCVVNPPTAGMPSYDTFAAERGEILESLRTRANTLADALNALPGITCAPTEGALYLFPRIHLPRDAVRAAHEVGVAPDEFYAMQMLEATGLVVVPGSGFGQPDPDSFHVRTTFLPPKEQLDAVIRQVGDFHISFMSKYGGAGGAVPAAP